MADKMKDVNATNLTPKELSWGDLKMILDNSFDEIYVLDGNGKIIYVNNVSYLHYGVDPGTLVGKSYHFLQELNLCSPPLVPTVMKEKRTLTMEQSTKTGKTITVTATPILNQDNTVQMIVMNSRDISNIIRLKNLAGQKQHDADRYQTALLHNQNFSGAPQDFVSQSRHMQECLALLQHIRKYDTTVLLLGESGVGKNVIARYIHNSSPRKNEPFITINCAAIPGELLESELFGYCKGAFSGASNKGKIGLAAMANHGTLFLDEIGELSFPLQAKILQLVQDHTFIPVGGTKERKVDIRILAATNQNLATCVEMGTFRKDLFYRLETIKIRIPSLHERREDIIPFVDLFLEKLNKKYKTAVYFGPQALKALERYSWPGNIREMEHLIERLVILAKKPKIDLDDLPKEFFATGEDGIQAQLEPRNEPSENLYIPSRQEEIENIVRCYLTEKSTYKAAKKLHISQSKVARIIKQYREQQHKPEKRMLDRQMH